MVENGNNVRLMDLGIANTAAYQSSSSSMMGTPKYAAPEQFGQMGSRESIDNRTDIYEFAVTIYELLCNENPFQSQTFNELIEKHKTLQLPYNNKIPKPIMDVLRKAAHPDKKMRYSNIVDFRNEFKKSAEVLNNEKQHDNTNPLLLISVIVLSLLTVLGIICFILI